MEAIAVGASLVAFIQLADRVIELCKSFIESVRNAPQDLRLILIEVSSLRCSLDNLQYLSGLDATMHSHATRALGGPGGTLDACKQCLVQLEWLLAEGKRQDCVSDPQNKGSKRRKIQQATTALAWPLKENKARKLLEEVSRHKSTITLALSIELSHDLKEVNAMVKTVERVVTDAERKGLYEWLETTNPSELHLKACSLHQKDTSLWMLESNNWKQWLAGNTRCLWLHGIPGAGKTILMSCLFENIPADTASVYYYCYFGHNQDETIPFLGWTIGQLCRRAGRIPASLVSTYNTGGRPSVEQLLAGLAEILENFSRVFILVDALDESREPRDQMLGVLHRMATESRFDKICLLASSREYLDIETGMSSISVSVPMQEDEVQVDIRKCAHTTMQTNRRFAAWPKELRRDIEDLLASQAKGMFRWAVCQLDILRRLSTVNEVREAIKSLPETLDETYERIFSNVPSHERSIVHRTLVLLCGHEARACSSFTMPAPILLSMVREDWSGNGAPEMDSLLSLDMLRDVCGCLVTITGASTATLAHFTVKEFLFSGRLWTSKIPNITLFALSPPFVTHYFLHAVLTGIISYRGPISPVADSAGNLYDYLLFIIYFALTQDDYETCLLDLGHLVAKVLDPNDTHCDRMNQVASDIGNKVRLLEWRKYLCDQLE